MWISSKTTVAVPGRLHFYGPQQGVRASSGYWKLQLFHLRFLMKVLAITFFDSLFLAFNNNPKDVVLKLNLAWGFYSYIPFAHLFQYLAMAFAKTYGHYWNLFTMVLT